MKNTVRLFSCLTIIFLGLTGCAPTTRLTSVWTDETRQGRKIEKVFVVGILLNETNRELVENEFVKALKARGIDAAASYTFVPFEQTADKEIIKSAVERYHGEAILTTRLIDTKTVQRIIVGEGNVCDRYALQDCAGYEPAISIVSHTFSLLETNLLDVRTEKLLWKAQSEIWMIEKDEALAKSFVRVILDRLSQDGIIPGGKGK